MKLRSVIAVIALTGAIPCVAGTPASVVITGFKNGSEQGTIINGGTTVGIYPAGEFKGFLNGNSFSTFCTDIYQSFGWNTKDNPYTYELKTVAETQGLWNGLPYTSGSYSQVSKLFTTAYASIDNSVNKSVASAAFQFALWEVLYETNNNAYDTAAGNFRLGGDGAGTVAARAQANIWLDSLANASEGYAIQSLFNDRKQDFLVATPVPEPQTYALALVSLGIVAGYARRKRDKA
jgi:PEP-CTERM motif